MCRQAFVNDTNSLKTAITACLHVEVQDSSSTGLRAVSRATEAPTSWTSARGRKKLNTTVLSAEQELKTLRQFIPRAIFLWEPPFAK